MNGRILLDGCTNRDIYMIFVKVIVAADDDLDRFILLYVYEGYVLITYCKAKQTITTMFDNEHSAFVLLAKDIRKKLDKFVEQKHVYYAKSHFDKLYESAIALEQYNSPAKLYKFEKFAEHDLLDEDYEHIKPLI